jgi:hypothetical protein
MMIKKGKATPFWSLGIFCIRLNVEPSDNKVQDIVVGIDPGSKREAFTVKSEHHTYLNVLANAVTWVKDAVETRKTMRRSRRQRKTPCRQNKYNRSKGGLAPSTKARWQLKLRIINKLRKVFPITDYVVEDISAKTKKNCKKWNNSFSPLEVGKNWFYSKLKLLGKLEIKQGYETANLREIHNLKKSSNKLADKFECHNVDSWVLANYLTGGHTTPDNIEILKVVPLQFHRRQLHRLQFEKGGIRKRYGGTISLGFKRGSITKHKKYGLCYVGGNTKGRLSLHNLKDGSRLCKNAKVEDTKFLSFNSFR